MFVIRERLYAHPVDKVYSLLGCYTAYSGPIFEDNESKILGFLALEDGNDSLSRKLGKALPLDVALNPRRT